MLPIVLRIYKGKALVEVRQFQLNQVVIGSPESDVQVQLDDASIAPIHAIVEKRGDTYHVADLGSETGTLVNGHRVLDQQISSGDQIQVGPYILEFHQGVPKPKMPPPRTGAGAGSAAAQKLEPEVQVSAPKAPPVPPAAQPVSPPVEQERPPASVTQFSDIKKPDSVLTQGPVSKHSRTAAASAGGRKRKGAGFAPSSEFTSIHEIVKPSKGTVVEVLVVWQERVLQTYHFSERQTVTFGPESSADVFVPYLRGGAKRAPLLQIDTQAMVLLSQGTDGEVSDGKTTTNIMEFSQSGRLRQVGAGYQFPLAQGEMLVFNLGEGLHIAIRYVAHTPRPAALPWIDLSGEEFMGIAVSVILVAIFALFMQLMAPEPLDEIEEEIIARVLVTPPASPRPPPPPPTPEVKAPPPQEERTQTKMPLPKETKVAEAPKPAPNPGARPRPSQSVRPRENRPRNNSATSAVKQGGAVKTSDKQGAQAQSQTKDPSQSGIFSVFGGGGQKKEIDQGYSGAGELSGLADAATGRAGEAENRPGEGLGSRFRDTGASGTGTSNYGVSGLDIKTSGRGSGDVGYGTQGLGGRQGARVVPGGAEEEFEGTIDREAIRRVINQHIRSIRSCYQSALNKDPALFGKLVMSWEIGTSGQAQNTRPVMSRSTLQSSEVSNCIVNRFARMKFPTPPHGQVAEVTFPFVFSPQ